MTTAGLPLILGSGHQLASREFLVGVEHEFRVLSGGVQVDFRELIHQLPIDGVRIDPGDRNAYRCRSGIAITADGREAEFATPPVAVRRGFVKELERWVRAGRAELDVALPPGFALEGYSTHISITVPDDVSDIVAARFVSHFSAAFALLLERADSQGIYVRPRPGRLELCGEFAEGEALGAAALFAVGAVKACLAGATAGLPVLHLETLPGVERFGVRVRRDSYGLDLYAAGRTGALSTAEGIVSVQAHLERAWHCARRFARELATAGELRPVEEIVGGPRPLGIERNARPGTPAEGPPPQSVFGVALRPPQRGKFAVSTALLTWDLAVFRLAGEREGYVGVPRMALAEFERQAARGKLDRQLTAFLRAPAAGRILEARAQVAEPALFDELGDTGGLIAAERSPVGLAGLPAGRTGKLSEARPWKATAGPAPADDGVPGEPGLPPLSPIRDPASPGSDGPQSDGPAQPPSGPPSQPPGPPPPPTFWTRFTVIAVALLALAGAVGAFVLVDATRSDTSHAVTATKTPAPTRAATLVPATPGESTATPSPTRAATRTPTATPTRPANGGGAAATETTAPSETETPTETATPSETATASPSPSATATTSTPTNAPSPTATATHTPTPTETAVVTIPAPATAVCVQTKGIVCPQ